MTMLKNILQEIEKSKSGIIRCGIMPPQLAVLAHQDKGLDLAIEIIKKHLSDNDEWIPVEKRLPEEHDSMFAKLKGTDRWSEAMFEKISDDVNVTVEYEDGTRKTTTAHILDGKWKLPNRVTKQKVVAWQPLPEPYRKDERIVNNV